jgi:hypothetical protein
LRKRVSAERLELKVDNANAAINKNCNTLIISLPGTDNKTIF